ncbi:acyl-CoA dehydratase activase [Vagococcus carniphilus]|uniref:Acyl-CoA dehydratase activase n=1 Tax=Vagococcus carniphilus TaxID=218144 RepID=A0AAW8U078_9ENTE|nr:acyl-CoA dehydratase activase [Vagococcus carniphilus]MDT2830433.1 acyl-CoA dehydratase activase [Vagococcus carniphilus]MDT2832469.1 acyl-CoA dehydratase activase [Vagococcus carniphilus]MDT2839998.1 acyl-CoA dehydratase activase [Vagococcus carniphilus]MDT2854489.1 acyl-CoA dehydratase activase [Vagococcus carniphilus]
MRVIGLDSGSTTTKGVLMEDDVIINQALVLTAGNPKKAMSDILETLGFDEETKLVTTGYGRKLVDADKCITEITCHAKGAKYLNPDITSIIDIGGQDSKTIKLDSFGQVEEFNMNDKCAAGTGRFVEVLMRILGEDIDHLDDFVKDAEPIKINSMCTVFAETEVISLTAKGEAREDIALGVLHSICHRIHGQYLKISPKQNELVFFSGGLSSSVAMKEILEDFTGRQLRTHPLAQYTGAIGAAKMLKKS